MKKIYPMCYNLFFLLFVISPMASPHDVTLEEKVYVGGYTQSSVDVLTRLVLLDDHTFCFAVTAGSLDLLAAGYWKSNPGKDAGISLHEVRQEQSLFPVFIEKVEGAKGQGDLVIFNFDGYSLSDANSPVFAVSATDVPPDRLRPLFSSENSAWSISYKLPPMKPDKARYFFIGHAEADKYDRPSRLIIAQYKVGDGNTVHVGFNRIQATPLMKMSARLINSVLHVDGNVLGKKDSLSAEVMNSVREDCVNPILKPAKASASKKCIKKPGSDCEDEEGSENTNSQMLAPVKTFHLELNAIKGAPWIIKGKD